MKATFSPIATLCSALTLLLLSSCASTMSRKECEKTDYYQAGLEDGKKGLPADRLQKFSEECSPHGLTIPRDRYTYGRQVGLSQFCTESRAKDDANDGKTDSVCLKEKVPPYETAYLRVLEERRKKTSEELSEIQESQKELQSEAEEVQGEVDEINQQRGTIQSE